MPDEPLLDPMDLETTQDPDQLQNTTTEGDEGSPPNPPVDPNLEMNQVLMQTVREQAQMMQNMQAQLASISDRQNAPPPPPEEPDPLDDPNIPEFQRDNLRAMDRLIQARLAKSVGPINQTAQMLMRQNQVSQAQAALTQHAEFGPIYAQIKNQMDSWLNSTNDLSPNTIVGALWMLYGQAAKNGALNTVPPVVSSAPPANPSIPNNRNTMPQRKPPAAPKPIITEGERRMMKIHKMTEAEWVAFRDSDGDMRDLVSITKDGRPNG